MNITHIRKDTTEETICGEHTGSSVSVDMMRLIADKIVPPFPDCVRICGVCLHKAAAYKLNGFNREVVSATKTE